MVQGQLQHKGMAAFGAEVTSDRAKAIRAYIVGQAIAAKKDEDAAAAKAVKTAAK